MVQTLRPLATGASPGTWVNQDGSAVAADMVASISEIERDDTTFIRGMGEGTFPLEQPSATPGQGPADLWVAHRKPPHISTALDLSVGIMQGASLIAQTTFKDIGPELLGHLQFDRALVTDWSALKFWCKTTLATDVPYDPDLNQPTTGIVTTLVRTDYASDAAAGAALVSAYNSMAAGTLRLRGNGTETGGGGWDIGTSVLRPVGNGRNIWADAVVFDAQGSITAPCNIYGSGPQVFDLSSRDGCQFDNLEISGSVYSSGTNDSGKTVLLHNSDAAFYKCYIHDGPICGASGYLDGTYFEDCEFSGSGFQGVSGVCAQVKMTNTTGLTRATVEFLRCYVHDGPKHGIWTDCNFRGLTLTNCTIVRHQGKDIFIEITLGPVSVTGCLIQYGNLEYEAATGGVTITSSTNVTFDGNTFGHNNGSGAGVYWAFHVWNDTRAGNNATDLCQRGFTVAGIVIQNNDLRGDLIHLNANVAGGAVTQSNNTA